MATLELLVGVPNQMDPVLISVPEGARVLEVVEIIKRHGETGLCDAEEVYLFIEGSDEALEGETRLDEHGISHRHRIHAHKCRTVDVVVAFGADKASKPFAAHVRVETVKAWAVEALNAPTENADYYLADRQTRLDENTHLRTLVHNCHLHLTLVSTELTIHYTVNAEPQVSNARHRTPRQIIEMAGLDPATHYLKHRATSYKDAPDEPILLHECEEFTALYSGGGTVS